jgi:hypothetical protein
MNSLLFVFPPAIADPGKSRSFPTYSVSFHIHDDTPIASVSTTNIRSDPVFSGDRKSVKFTNNSVSCIDPFTIAVVLSSRTLARCLRSTVGDSTYLLVTSTAPRAVRNLQTAFTLIIQQDKHVNMGQLSLILRAVEFFILSLPKQCRLNIVKYGDGYDTLYPQPIEVSGGNRGEFMEFARKVATIGKPATFQTVLARIAPGLPRDIDSAVVVVGTAFAPDAPLPPDSRYFFLDPVSHGDTREFAAQNGASFIPVIDQNSLFSSLLLVLKVTAAPPIADVMLIVDGEREQLTELLPAMTFSSIHQFRCSGVRSARISWGSVVQDLPIADDSTNSLQSLWAFASHDEGLILPDGGGVVVFERDTAADDSDISLLEIDVSKLGRTGELHHRERPKPQGPPPSPPKRGGNRPPPRRSYMQSTVSTTVSTYVQSQQGPQRLFEGYWPAEAEAPPWAPLAPRPPQPAEARKAAVWPDVVASGRRPFFMLRLMQIQNFDGSWNDGNAIQTCCGAPLPPGPGAMEPLQFLTAFAIAAFLVKSPADAAKWELVVEKGFMFLERADPTRNWKAVIEEFKAKYY